MGTHNDTTHTTTMCRHTDVLASHESNDVEDDVHAQLKPASLLSYIHGSGEQMTALSPSFDAPHCFEAPDAPWLQPGMPRELSDALWDSASLVRFLASPVPEELGLVRFRLLGDHSDAHMWLVFDYLEGSDEPSLDQRVLSAVR